MADSKHLYIRRASAGSGKTYTLAAHYIALLLRGESFRSILAVTFTNKATAEMKERIVGYLYAIARFPQDGSTQAFLSRVREIYAELGFPAGDICLDSVCSERAERIFTDIMSDYDAMRVQTIDAFLQTLLSGMVQMLGGSTGYAVELDTRHVIAEAVDRLLTVGARDPQLLAHITRYIDENLADDHSWDIRSNLCALGEQLYHEFLQQNEHRLVFDPEALTAFGERMRDWRTRAAADLAELQRLLTSAQSFTKDTFKRGQTSYIAPLDRLRQSVSGEISERDEKSFLVGFTPATQAKIADPDAFADEYRGHGDSEPVRRLLTQIIASVDRCRGHLLYGRFVTAFLNDMFLMGALREQINRSLDENNTRLLATTAGTLSRALQTGDADFVLEKAGIRYRHIMLDEFQDTSSLQWENFSLLVQEVLAKQPGSTLIVGDIKQSIYRWRNGDWRIMSDLPASMPEYYNRSTPQLTRNFRSEREIVRFNLDTFAFLSERESADIASLYGEGYRGDNLADYYRSGHDGGFVLVRAYPYPDRNREVHDAVRRHILTDMFARIDLLLSRGVRADRILILLRFNREADAVMEVLDSLRSDPQYPHLATLSLVSGDCFKLGRSRTVSLLVEAIRYVYTDDGVSLAFVQSVAPDFDLHARLSSYRRMALTDMVEDVLQHAVLASAVPPSDMAYINTFRDLLRSYVRTHGSDGRQFVRDWTERLADKSIPSVEGDGVRLMTVHSSKGLQAENVFIPFASWPMEGDRRDDKLWCEVPELSAGSEPALLPVRPSADLLLTPLASAYTEEHRMQRIDNLNLLYVALTRAAERLFVYMDVPSDSNSRGPKPRSLYDVGMLLAERCGLWNRLHALFALPELGLPDQFAEFTQGEISLPDPETILRRLYGDSTEKPQSVERSVTEPFSFVGVPAEPASCHSLSSHLEFRQSQDSVTYGWDIASRLDDPGVFDRRAFGQICHDILSEVGCYDSLEQVQDALRAAVERAFAQGRIPSAALRDELLPLLLDTVSDPQLLPWFVGSWRVLREETILFLDDHREVEERRMDRVMWDGDRAVVLDYKFGHDDPRYDRQVQHYMRICRQMGAHHVEGYLYIASQHVLQPVQL